MLPYALLSRDQYVSIANGAHAFPRQYTNPPGVAKAGSSKLMLGRPQKHPDGSGSVQPRVAVTVQAPEDVNRVYHLNCKHYESANDEPKCQP